tara:strand:+ start:363 stop:875 length:513 start_codon:yes stop_codon:yes gene_type:complete
MDFTLGEDRLMFIKVNGAFLPIGCLTANSIEETSEFIDTTTRDNGGWSTSRPVTQSYTLNFSGLQVNTTLAGGNFNIASYDKLREFKRSKTLLEWKIQGTKYPIVDFGKCYIQVLSDTENIGEFLAFSGTAVGFGSPQYQSLGETILNNGDPNVLINNGNPDVLIRTEEV